MFSKTKIIQILEKYVFNKNVNRSSLAKIIIVGLVITFCSITSIKAQIGNDLYGQQTGDLAGISSLMLAVSSNDIEGVKFFSRAGGFLINQKNVGGATALHLAARNGNLEIANILLENGADTNVIDNEGWTPLMRAAISANAKIVEVLLNKGANPSLLNSNRESVLIHATVSDCADCLNAIFTKSDLIKTMDTKLLKEQLVDAFIIARNRENKVTQNLLEGYLDRAMKMTPLVVSGSGTTAENANNNIVAGNSVAITTPTAISQPSQQFMAQDGKVKYILVDEENKQTAPAVMQTTQPTVVEETRAGTPEQTTIIAPAQSHEDHSTSIIPSSQPQQPSTISPTISNLVESALMQPNPNPSKSTNKTTPSAAITPMPITTNQNQKVTSNITATPTKFKFVSGAPGVAMNTNEAPIQESQTKHCKTNQEQTIYKLKSAPSQTEPKTIKVSPTSNSL